MFYGGDSPSAHADGTDDAVLAALDFKSSLDNYTSLPASQTVTVTNNESTTLSVTLPTSTNYTVTAGDGFTGNTAELAPGGKASFTVQPKSGLSIGDYFEKHAVCTDSAGETKYVTFSFLVIRPHDVADIESVPVYDTNNTFVRIASNAGTYYLTFVDGKTRTLDEIKALLPTTASCKVLVDHQHDVLMRGCLPS